MSLPANAWSSWGSARAALPRRGFACAAARASWPTTARPLGALGRGPVARGARRRRWSPAGTRRRGSARPTSSSSRPAFRPCRRSRRRAARGVPVVGRGRAGRRDSMTHPAPSSPSAGRTARARRRRSSALCSRPPARARSRAATSVSPSPSARASPSTSWSSRCRASRWSASTVSGRTSAALLNVTDDHLDRYADFDAYARAKGNAFVSRPPTTGPSCPRRRDVPRARRAAARGASSTFGPDGDVDVTGDAVVDRRSGERYPRAEMALSRAATTRSTSPPRSRASRRSASTPTASAACSRRSAACPHRMALVAEIGRRALLRRLQGHERGRGGHGARGPRRTGGGAHRGRARQGRQLRAARRTRSRARAARPCSSARPPRPSRRPSATAFRCAAPRTHGRGRARRRVARDARRRGAPLACVLQLRHVPRLQAPRRRVRRARCSALRARGGDAR